MRSRPILTLMLHQDWQVCTVWRYSQSVFEHHTLWVEPRHVLGSTPPGPITYQNRDTMCSYNMIKEWDFGLIVLFYLFFFGGEGSGGSREKL